MKIEIDFKATLWTSVKANCPICHKTFTGWYCPSCGLPKKNSKYAIYKGYEDVIHNCDKYHFRPEFSRFEDFQLCEKCYSTNPANAKYCRNCGKQMNSFKGIAKNAHGWIDLGLSVLWATEIMDGFYLWNHSSLTLDATTNMDYYKDFKYRDHKDIATERWGERWRTPTKEEFEELIIKCKWEKYLDPISKKHALKVTGPNGNSIIIPVTGFAGCNQKDERESGTLGLGVIPKESPEAEYSKCYLWTSSGDISKATRARAFVFAFTGYEGFTKTLTSVEKKEKEFEYARYKRKIDEVFNRLDESSEQMIHRWKMELKKEKEERQIIRDMGDDSKERANNAVKDMERRHRLWLDTPIEMHYQDEQKYMNTIRCVGVNQGYSILPVADKKWQGKL